MWRRRGLRRKLGIFAVSAGMAACKTSAKPVRVVAPTPIPRVTVAVHSNGKLETRDGRTFYDDVSRDLTMAVPPGWSGVTDFSAGEEGPPPAGELRLRVRLGPDPYCVIDLAFEPAANGAEGLRAAVTRGRDLFFFSQTDEPSSRLPGVQQWASTAVPPTPGKTDFGYWLTSPDRVLRLEGRFPNDRVPECKEALDAMVMSLAPRGAGGAASRAAPDANPG